MTEASTATGAVIGGTGERRILAVVLPNLLCELALQRLQAPYEKGARAKGARAKGALRKLEPPRAIVLVDYHPERQHPESQALAPLEGNTELDAVNSTAFQLGVRPRQTIAQASAIIENLTVQAIPRACVSSALKHIAEVALGFGAPVSFQAPDTVWVDISGSSHLFASERELALELIAQIKALGHSIRVAVAHGPWLAQSFARYAQLEEAGVLLVDRSHTARAVGQLPSIALPIHREAVGWFSRLGLLNLEDLRKLPRASLAARLEGQILKGIGAGAVLDLIQGQDDGLLIPHHPEEMPHEELFWEDPLVNVEPLVFVLKGLSGRLSARLEARGQAARELLLTLHYDRSIAALVTPEGKPVPETKALSFKLASPLFHAEDLERVMRLRLQRQNLAAPTLGLSLQATAVTEARHCQMGLSETAAWKSGISTDPRSLTLLVAELSSDIGVDSVGLLITEDSHLLEKSSALLPIHASSLADGAASTSSASAKGSAAEGWFRGRSEAALEGLSLPRLPTRLLDPAIEIHAPIRKHELWVVREQAFVVSDIHFEQRLEGVEWWDRTRVFRDYYRVWLAIPADTVSRDACSTSRMRAVRMGAMPMGAVPPTGASVRSLGAGMREKAGGLEALVYWDRERGKSYLHALYD